MAVMWVVAHKGKGMKTGGERPWGRDCRGQRTRLPCQPSLLSLLLLSLLPAPATPACDSGEPSLATLFGALAAPPTAASVMFAASLNSDALRSCFRRRKKRQGCACGGQIRAGCVFRPLRISLRGGRSKRGGKRVKAALAASGGKTAAAARFPVRHWQGGKLNPLPEGGKDHPRWERAPAEVSGERTTSLHLDVRDRATVGAQGVRVGGWAPKKKKKLSKRQLANAARAKHRGNFADQLMRELAELDPDALNTDPYVEYARNPMKFINMSLYGDPEDDPEAGKWLKDFKQVWLKLDAAIDNAPVVRSGEDMLAMRANGTVFRLPDEVHDYIDSVYGEGYVRATSRTDACCPHSRDCQLMIWCLDDVGGGLCFSLVATRRAGSGWFSQERRTGSAWLLCSSRGERGVRRGSGPG